MTPEETARLEEIKRRLALLEATVGLPGASARPVPQSAAGPWPPRLRAPKRLIHERESRSRGTRADRGVRPTRSGNGRPSPAVREGRTEEKSAGQMRGR